MMDLDKETLNKIWEVSQKLTPILMDKMNASGSSLRVNYGDSQEIKHFHMHLLPNYQYKKPTLTQDESYEILKDACQ